MSRAAADAAYIERVFAREDAVLRALRREIRRRRVPEIYISAEEGRLLQILLTAIGARRVLEIGTLGGYSSIWIARALPLNGRLLTLEIEELHAQLAREFARRAGLARVIEVRTGPALALLPRIARAEQPFDACFIDADKINYPAYLRWARRLVRPGGLILGDNALWDGRVAARAAGDADTRAIRRFNRELAAARGIRATIINVRDGLAVGVVLPRRRRRG